MIVQFIKTPTMKKRTVIHLILLFTLTYSSTFAQEDNLKKPELNGSVLAGYNNGLGLQANIMLSNFSEEFPFKLRFGTGYTFLNPGNAMDARRIFINNASNGVPEEKGSILDFRFDFLLPAQLFKSKHSYFVFGPRYSMFKGNFKYVGGNEDFDIKSQQWGIGAGIENHFKMTEKLDLIFAIGLDYYFPSKLSGHDTAYSPDNDNVSPRKDNQNGDVYFKYKDADKAIDQPRFMPRVMLGVGFSL